MFQELCPARLVSLPLIPEPEWLRWFDELAELTAAERSAALAVLARDRPDLAGRLGRLFAAEEDATDLLSRPLAERAPELVTAAFAPEHAPGERIGPYRLLELLGRGGMGEVFLAERADGVFEQRVALKLVKRGMDSEEILRRFHRERQILARLEHPGIARILDGGTAPDGRPYFVLERVEGEPILAWCRRTRPALEERLRLVIAACEAVDAAHRNLVVHRDLKPSNLLVTAEGQVKLLDFGIAKLLADENAEPATQQEKSFFTPAYAAPEQVLGEPVTTATDVYALGVILYELLAGRSPHDGAPAVLRGDDRETTERPSAVLRRGAPDAEADRAGIPDRKRFARRVQGDLDTVVLTALRRDPARRYRSAADFAADLRRFLEERPIRARPDSALYRGRKLLLRHKLAAAALAAAVVALTGGLALSLREARIAQAEARRAERVKGFLLAIFREANPESGQGQTATAREILATGARRVRTELAREPAVQAELLDAIAQIEQSLALYEPAHEAATASLLGRRQLFGADSAPAALSLTTLAEVTASQGHLEDALRLAEQARPAVERSYAAESDEALRLARLRVFLLKEQGRSEPALALVRDLTARTRRRFGPRSIETARRLIDTANILSDLSRFQEAEQTVRQVLSILKDSPKAPLSTVADARQLLGELLAITGHREQAAAQYATTLDLQRKVFGARHVEVAFTLIRYGFLLNELRRYPEAESTLREAIAILEPLDHYETGSARRYLGFCLMSQERYREAEQQFVAVERFLRQKVGPDNPLVWATLLSEGWVRLKLGRLDEAERDLSTVVAHYEPSGAESNEIRTALKYLGEAARLEGRIEQALALHRRARAIELKLFATAAHPGVAASDYQIALDLLAAGKPGPLAEARQKIDEAIAFLRRDDATHPRLDEFLVASGRIALAAADRARARQDLGEAVARLREHRGPDHPATREAESLLRRAA